MPYHKPPTDAPHDWGEPVAHHFLIGPTGHRHPITRVTRRSITIAYGPRQLRLRRRHLERHGFEHVDGRIFAVSSYYTESG